MALHALKRLTSGPKPVALLLLLILMALYLMSAATQHSALFGKLYSWILGINILAMLLLLALIGRNLFALIQQYRQRVPGSRLTVRLLTVFIILALAPILVLYYFSVQFLHRGIDSWFELRIEYALEDALELGRSALDTRLRELVRQTRQQVEQLANESDAAAPMRLHELRDHSDAVELTLLTINGRVLGSSSIDPSMVVPTLPNSAIMQQLRSGIEYVGVEPIDLHGGMHMRIVLPVPNPAPLGDPRLLHALYSVPERLDTLASNVQQAYHQYSELEYLRQPLKYSFTLTLSLVLLLSLLTAVWAAFFSARRLTAPIRDLAAGTQAVAEGNYDMRLPIAGHDELGFLVVSFNDMTRRIARARDEAQQSQQLAEEQRGYVEAILACLSSGVITLDEETRLRTANSAAGQILGLPLTEQAGVELSQLDQCWPSLQPLLETIQAQLAQGDDWQAEVVLFGPSGRQVLICRGSPLHSGESTYHGHVIVFDDITTLLQAQRDAAWGEVARRLAHEIKNPLTPIQLSAERLRHKYLGTMAAEDAELLDRSTHTIVQQVQSMKEMVQAFSDYARPPQLQLQTLDLGQLLQEVLDLYRGDPHLNIELHIKPGMPTLRADAGRMRQLLHNLIKNTLEARQQANVLLRIELGCTSNNNSCTFIEMRFHDDGPGFPEALLGHLFEPYVSNKPKGTGLGLAIAKKIVEEHSGMLWAANHEEGGALIGVRLPLNGEAANNL